MPGFSSRMIPALQIDYGEVARRVTMLKDRLDRAEEADVRFLVDGRREFRVNFDLKFREAHASTGRFPDPGTAGNLPSGEAYIVPYEGEKDERSRTQGVLPVQIQKDLVLYSIVENRAVHADGEGEAARIEREKLRKEPAYGNMSELGFGVLEDFGLQPIGEILLDEKLGFHVAFGRSDHFGGAVGPKDFSSPKEVIHLDRIYIPASQPRIKVQSVVLGYPDQQPEQIMGDGKYLVF
jgi:leucyl aminopeptidase (aminopeptidase T)